MKSNNLLEVKNIVYAYGQVTAVDGVSFALVDKDSLGLVGESGSGKSTLGRCIAGLLKPQRGRILYRGHVINGQLHKEIQLVFQDSFAALNPRMKVGSLVEEGLIINRNGNKEERRRKVREVLQTVGIDPELISRFPHQLSGGQRQRVALARTLILNPRLLILDEPVSSLDVTTGMRLLSLLRDLKFKHNLAYIFISHDLAVVRQICRRVAVMYAGKIVELGDVEAVFSRPAHFYTKLLLEAHPIPDPEQRKVIEIRGEAVDLLSPPSGCRFHPRCLAADQRCRRVPPPFIKVADNHKAACHKAL
ncbi:MAG: ABC transporter ATP-binding protein [Firmicutes bacterium]|nr:ABC transporter ATP-binding protein [Bacillota bacterium]